MALAGACWAAGCVNNDASSINLPSWDAGPSYTPPKCGKQCQDYLTGLALTDTVWLVYNENIAGHPAGNSDVVARCPLGGSVHITGTTSVASDKTTTAHLKFDMTNCSNSSSLYSLTFTGAVSMDGTFRSGADKFTAVTWSTDSIVVKGALKFYDNPDIAETCELSETQQDSSSTQALNGRVCGREFSSSTALKNPDDGSNGSAGSGGAGGGGSAGAAGSAGDPGTGGAGTISTGGPGCPSIYEGTYIGQFAYDYTTAGPTPMMGTGSFNLTVTLACIATANGTVTLQITHANASDPYFGCGVSGCTPSQASVATLPDSPPTTPSNASKSGEGISISFPNGTILGTENGVANLNVTTEGRTLSNALSGSSSTWSAVSLGGTVFPNDGRTITNYKSWSLTKSAL